MRTSLVQCFERDDEGFGESGFVTPSQGDGGFIAH
jgi:hypothetical protein